MVVGYDYRFRPAEVAAMVKSCWTYQARLAARALPTDARFFEKAPEQLTPKLFNCCVIRMCQTKRALA